MQIQGTVIVSAFFDAFATIADEPLENGVAVGMHPAGEAGRMLLTSRVTGDLVGLRSAEFVAGDSRVAEDCADLARLQVTAAPVRDGVKSENASGGNVLVRLGRGEAPGGPGA